MPWNHVKKAAPLCPGCGRRMAVLHTDQYHCHECLIEASYKKRPAGYLNVYGVLQDGKRQFLCTAKAVTA